MQEEIIKYKIEVFSISETKLDIYFPISQFIIKGYGAPFRLNRNQNGGSLLLYVREDIPCRIFNKYTSETENSNENVFAEINLRSTKWLLSCSYKPNTNLITDHLQSTVRGIDFYLFLVIWTQIFLIHFWNNFVHFTT